MFFRTGLRWVRLEVAIVLLATVGQLIEQDSDRRPVLNHFDVRLVDRSVDPCLDFYKFACGNWLEKNPVPPSESLWNTRSDLQRWNWMMVRQEMERASRTDPTRTAIEQKIGDYWYACMDEAAIEKEGVLPNQDELRRSGCGGLSDLVSGKAPFHRWFLLLVIFCAMSCALSSGKTLERKNVRRRRAICNSLRSDMKPPKDAEQIC